MKRYTIVGGGLLLAAAVGIAVLVSVPHGASAGDPTAAGAVPQDLVPRIDRVLARVEGRELRGDRDSPSTLLHAILAHGTGLRVHDPESGGSVPALGYLLDGRAARGRRLLEAKDGKPTLPDPARHPHLQAHRDQILMVLASAGVSPERRLTAVGGETFTVAQVLAASRRGFVEHQELGWTLAALAAYAPSDARWTTEDGATYGVEDLVKLAIYRDPRMESCGGTHHLYGVACALERHRSEGGAVEGAWERARVYLETFVHQARSWQQESGELSAAVFRGPAAARSRRDRIFATGHGLEWLTAALPRASLEDEWVRRAVAVLCHDLLEAHLDTLDASALYHAAHALRRYREAVTAESDSGRPTAAAIRR